MTAENAFDVPRALYIHLPFCVRRCAYCDFTTEAADRDDERIDAYVEELCLEIRRMARAGRLRAIETIYIGGGTPTHVGARRLSMLLYTLGVSLTLNADVEITIEANPESLTPALVRDLWALGVNRLSIGVQSFDDEVLRFLGRAHDATAALRAIEAAHERFSNVSVDLMAAIPGQSEKSLITSIETAIEAGVTHLSLYPLMIEEGTPMERRLRAGLIEAVDEDRQADALLGSAELLRSNCFEHYEIASFARPGSACRHNLAYWHGVPYEGLGRSAVSMRQNADRRVRVCDGAIVESLDRRQMIAEDLMLGMRCAKGVDETLLARARAELAGVDDVIAEVVELGLARRQGSSLVPTDRGFLLGNELFGRFLALAP